MPQRSYYTLLTIIIFLLVVSNFNTLDSPPILDDQHSFLFTKTLQLKDLSLPSINNLRENQFGISRLVPVATLALNNYFSHGRAADYHITNVLIHILTLFTLFYFLRQLLRLPIVSGSLKVLDPLLFGIAVVGIWALNPVQTNAVTYIVQRMTAICALFYLLCLGLYLKGRNEPSLIKSIAAYTGAAIAAILALLSKENSATLPLAILLLEDTFLSPGKIRKSLAKFIHSYWLPIFALLLIVLPLLQDPIKTHILNAYKLRDFTLSERLLTESRIVVWYITLLLLPLPSRMNIDHDVLVSHSFFAPLSTIFSIIALLTLFLYANKIRHRMPLVSFGFMFFLLNLAIESTIVPLELIFEHRLYLPSVGFFISMTALADQGIALIPNIKTRDGGNIIKVSLVIIFASYSVLTTFRNMTFQDELTVYADMAEKSPNKARALNNYGMVLAKTSRHEEAILILQKAFSVGRQNQEAYYAAINNLLIANEKKFGIEYSIAKTEELLARVPPFAQTNQLDRLFHNLAYAYYQTGQFDKAYECIKLGLLLFPHESNALSAALCMKIISSAYPHPAYKEKLELKGNTENEAVLNTSIATLINARDYRKATELNAKLRAINTERADEWDNALMKISQKSAKAAKSSAVNNEKNLPYSRSFRWRIKLADHITKYYRPLTPIVPLLINKVAKSAPDDPFVSLIKLRILTNDDPGAAKKMLTDQLLPKHPEFTPFLLMAFRLSYADDHDFAYKIGSQLLDIYPDILGWKGISLYLAAYENRSTASQLFPIRPEDPIFLTIFD